MKDELQKEIESMGMSFRNLTLHSDGQWSCAFFHKGNLQPFSHDGYANNPIDAIKNAKEMLRAASAVSLRQMDSD